MADTSSTGACTRHVSAQPATPAPCLSAATPCLGERELRIDYFSGYCVLYEGTAAQLVAEGLIPKGFDWPRAAANKRWQTKGFDYSLRRTCPKGLKGPLRTWLEMDNWRLDVRVTGRDGEWRARQAIERQRQALRDIIHFYSDAGMRESMARTERWVQADQDQAFQAFKSTFVPSRKAKAVTKGVQHA